MVKGVVTNDVVGRPTEIRFFYKTASPERLRRADSPTASQKPRSLTLCRQLSTECAPGTGNMASDQRSRRLFRLIGLHHHQTGHRQGQVTSARFCATKLGRASSRPYAYVLNCDLAVTSNLYLLSCNMLSLFLQYLNTGQFTF